MGARASHASTFGGISHKSRLADDRPAPCVAVSKNIRGTGSGRPAHDLALYPSAKTFHSEIDSQPTHLWHVSVGGKEARNHASQLLVGAANVFRQGKRGGEAGCSRGSRQRCGGARPSHWSGHPRHVRANVRRELRQGSNVLGRRLWASER